MTVTTRWSAVVGVGLALALAAASPAGAVAGATARSAPAASAAASATSGPLTAGAVGPRAGWAAELDAAAARLGVPRAPAHELVRRALEAEPGCQPGALDAYVGGLLAGLDTDELEFLLLSGALDFPFVDALLFGSSADPRYAIDAEYRRQLSNTFRDGQRFWDVPTSDIQLLGLDGGVLRDEARLTRLLHVAYELPAADAAEYARLVVAAVAQIPALQGGDNPIFSLNAFAFTAEGQTHPLIAPLPDMIVMGDGINDFFEHLGIADVGPRAVLAHELAHHVQFENDLFDSPLTGPEATRRTELMADALATYFATHSRGLTLNAKRVVSAVQAFHAVGDCGFDDPGHHGTPTQRARAALWGADQAGSAQKKGWVLPSMTLADRFEAALPRLVAPAG